MFRARTLWTIFLGSCAQHADTIIYETCANGFSMEVHIDDHHYIRELAFSDGSGVSYAYNNHTLTKITRYDSLGNTQYAQTYHWDDTKLISHTGWFTAHYAYDASGRVTAKINPWLAETIEYDDADRPSRAGNKTYVYDHLGQITEESGSFQAEYDRERNLISLNDNAIHIDAHNKVIGHPYDTNGNQLKAHCTFGNNNMISEAYGERYTYDAQDRLIQKGETHYLYLGHEEIASFKDGRCRTLKVPGLGGPIAIEIDGKPYAPVSDAAGIIRKLVDPDTYSVVCENHCDIFGNNLTDAIPYAYRGKRIDPRTGLIYFGRRFYDPSLHRWISPDPLGAIDHPNLYQYVLNNPLQYHDPDGCKFWRYVAGIGEMALGGIIMVGGVGLEIVTFGGFTVGFGVVEGAGLALMAHGCAKAMHEAKDLSPPRFDGKDLGMDPSKCPGEGFEWKGSGPPESGKGNWVNETTKETFYPDLNHPEPKGSHWDYTDPDKNKARLFPDGTWEWK